MYIVPQQRQPMVRAHNAKIPRVSRATVHADRRFAGPEQSERTEHGWTTLNEAERG